MRKILGRTSTVPFELAIALLLTITGAFALFHVGPVDQLTSILPEWEAVSLDVLAIVSGLSILSGVAFAKTAMEIAGIWFLNGSLIARVLLYGRYLGFSSDFFVTGFINLVFFFAGLARWISIVRGHTIIKAKDENSPTDVDNGSNGSLA